MKVFVFKTQIFGQRLGFTLSLDFLRSQKGPEEWCSIERSCASTTSIEAHSIQQKLWSTLRSSLTLCYALNASVTSAMDTPSRKSLPYSRSTTITRLMSVSKWSKRLRTMASKHLTPQTITTTKQTRTQAKTSKWTESKQAADTKSPSTSQETKLSDTRAWLMTKISYWTGWLITSQLQKTKRLLPRSNLHALRCKSLAKSSSVYSIKKGWGSDESTNLGFVSPKALYCSADNLI